MDKKVIEQMELIFNMADNFEKDARKNTERLYRINYLMSELIWEREFDNIVKVKRILNDELINKQIQDRVSYNLGKAHALIEITNCLYAFADLEKKIGLLTDKQKELLLQIYDKGEIHKKDIEGNADNEIRDLKKKDMIYEYVVGRNRWYSLSLKGIQAVQSLKG